MRAVLAAISLALSMLIAAVPAQAARHVGHRLGHHRARLHVHRVAHARHHLRFSHRWRAHHPPAYAGGDARPSAWCGWYMRRLLGVADRTFNLARNWAHWGRPAAAAPGAVVVWPHHVGLIRGGPDGHGRWLVESGNDGHAVRTRYRSLAGAIAFRRAG